MQGSILNSAFDIELTEYFYICKRYWMLHEWIHIKLMCLTGGPDDFALLEHSEQTSSLVSNIKQS